MANFIEDTKDIDSATEIECIIAFQAGKANALDAIARSHEKLVRATALRLMKSNPHADLDDMKSAGRIGLVEAARKFDTTKGIRFNTFAVHYIRSEILTFLRKDTLVPFALGVATKRVFYNLTKKCIELGFDAFNLNDRQIEIVAIALDVKPDVITLVASRLEAKTSASIEENEDGSSYMPCVEATQEADVIALDESSKLKAAIDDLPYKHREVISMRALKQKSYEKIARALSVSENTVKELEVQALDMLRRALGAISDQQSMIKSEMANAEERGEVQTRAPDLAVRNRVPRLEQCDRNWSQSRREKAYQLWLPGLGGCAESGAERPVRSYRNKSGKRKTARNAEALAFSF